MKKFILLLALSLLISSDQFAQILNSGFENWTNGDPDGWDTFDNGSLDAVTQSSDAHSGSSAARLEIIENSAGGPFAPWIESGEAEEGFMVSERFESLSGFYKFTPVGNDIVSIFVQMIANSNLIGTGILFLGASSSYTQFVLPIHYSSSETPDLARISIFVSDSTLGGMLEIGSYALIDDLAFGGAVGVGDKSPSAETFQLKQNYPNPFNPSTTIEFSVPEESAVEIKIYNILGVEVSELVKGSYSPGNYKATFNGENLASGIYLAKITATAQATRHTFSKTVKMTLLK